MQVCEDAEMSTTAEKFVTVNQGFRARLVGLTEEQLTAPTPCEGWTANGCIDHVLSIYLLVLTSTGADVQDLEGASPLERFDHLAPLLEAAVSDPVTGGQEVKSPFGPMALKQLVSGIVIHDTLVHTWDLAKAVDGDLQLDEELVTESFAKMLPMDEGLRNHGAFAEKRSAPEGADIQTQFLSFLGRTV